MFGPNTPQSIEISAALRRAEDQQWAANERLARSVRMSQPSWVASQIASLLGVIRGKASAAQTTPATTPCLGPVEATCEDDLFDSSDSGLMAA